MGAVKVYTCCHTHCSTGIDCHLPVPRPVLNNNIIIIMYSDTTPPINLNLGNLIWERDYHFNFAARHLQPTMATGGMDMMTARISEACEAGDKFVEVFYDTMDKRRQVR
jgi:hypothetical protein